MSFPIPHSPPAPSVDVLVRKREQLYTAFSETTTELARGGQPSWEAKKREAIDRIGRQLLSINSKLLEAGVPQHGLAA